jgi:choline kinase
MGGHKPKTLIPLDGRRPLLGYVLDGLARAEISDVLIVTGFQPAAVEEFVGENAENMEVTYVFNARYASWGNFHSVRLAIDQSPGKELLVVNSDIIVNPDVFTRVVASSGDLILAVQSRQNLDEEDMRVELDSDRVRGIGKGIRMVRSHAEFIGVSLLRPAAARPYQEIASDVEWQAQTSGYYEDIYSDLLDRIDVRATLVEEGEYAEVDKPEDVAAAVEVVNRYWEQSGQTESEAKRAESRPA